MIFSSYEYAQSLGFQPHKDFENHVHTSETGMEAFVLNVVVMANHAMLVAPTIADKKL